MSLPNLPKVQAFQTALPDKTKRSPSFRFYSLYGDDFVICCRGTADEAMSVMRRMMDTLKLTVNETKTRIARLPDESFDFLGDTIGRVDRPTDGSAYLGTKPSRKKLIRFLAGLSARTARSITGQAVTELIADLNQKIRGWANYFRLGSVTKADHAVNRHACSRLRQWLCSQHQRRGQGFSRDPDHVLHQEFGLIQLTASNRRYLASVPMTFLIREPDAGNLHVRFDERDVETNPSKDTAPRLDSTPPISPHAKTS